MDYRTRLEQFNDTPKYRGELAFLLSLVGVETSPILDYGCGIGTAIKYLQNHTSAIVRGYDVKCHADEKSNWFLDYPPQELYGHIFFMHSLAHINQVNEVIYKLRDNLLPTGKITVITPNLDWLNTVGNYKSDPTVVAHFTQSSLTHLFESHEYKVIKQGQFGKEVNGLNERLFIQVGK